MALTSTVTCKLPHGLILRITDMVKVMQPVFAGSYREMEEGRLRTTSVRPDGYAAPHGMMPRDPQGGYALTPNVDAEFFRAWMQQHRDHPLDPENLPRQFRHDPSRPGIRGITKATSGAS